MRPFSAALPRAQVCTVFFAHCHPHRLIIHKTSFFGDLTLDRVPRCLLNAICALAAPLSLSPRLRTSPPRLAGLPYAAVAHSLLIDQTGRLRPVQPTLAAAQALVLLQMHELALHNQVEPNTTYSGARRTLSLSVAHSRLSRRSCAGGAAGPGTAHARHPDSDPSAVRRAASVDDCAGMRAADVLDEPIDLPARDDDVGETARHNCPRARTHCSPPVRRDEFRDVHCRRSPG